MAGTKFMGGLKPYLNKEGNWWVFRYGFEKISDADVYIYVEHKFIKKPSEERMRTLMENYNKENKNKIDINKIINSLK